MIQDPTLWIGEVPEHWKLLKGKELFVQVKRGLRDDDGTVTAFRDGVVTLRSNRRTTGFTEAVQFSGYQGVEPGDLVIHQMDGFAGAIGVSDSRGRCSPVCAVSVPRDTANTYYYARVLRAMAVSGWIAALAKGIRERSTDFRFSVFRDQMLPVPPEEEQALIVRYLDHAELRIAKAIAGKLRLASLLTEQLASLKEFWLLHGGDSGRLAKVQGLEHLGMISPAASAHPAGLLFKEVRRPPLPDIPKLSLSLARGLVRSDSISQKGSALSSSLKYSMTCEGDLVLNKYRAYLGAFAATSENGLITPNYTVLAPCVDLDSRFYANLFSTHTFQALWLSKSKGVGDGMMPLYTNEFRRTHVPWFPVEIQKQLATSFENSARSTQQAIDRVSSEIALLKEYRTRLISDVVTGKIGIREEAAKLTDIDPAELAGVLAGGTAAVDEEEAADGDD